MKENVFLENYQEISQILALSVEVAKGVAFDEPVR